jgi:hypothetical protein
MSYEDSLTFMMNEKKCTYDLSKKMIIVIFSLLVLGKIIINLGKIIK